MENFSEHENSMEVSPYEIDANVVADMLRKQFEEQLPKIEEGGNRLAFILNTPNKEIYIDESHLIHWQMSPEEMAKLLDGDLPLEQLEISYYFQHKGSSEPDWDDPTPVKLTGSIPLPPEPSFWQNKLKLALEKSPK